MGGPVAPSSGRHFPQCDVRLRRICVIAVRPREGPFTESKAGVRRGRWRLQFMPDIVEKVRRRNSSAILCHDEPRVRSNDSMRPSRLNHYCPIQVPIAAAATFSTISAHSRPPTRTCSMTAKRGQIRPLRGGGRAPVADWISAPAAGEMLPRSFTMPLPPLRKARFGSRKAKAV